MARPTINFPALSQATNGTPPMHWWQDPVTGAVSIGGNCSLTAAGGLVFTLSVGARPAETIPVGGGVIGGGATTYVLIDSTGRVYCQAASGANVFLWLPPFMPGI